MSKFDRPKTLADITSAPEIDRETNYCAAMPSGPYVDAEFARDIERKLALTLHALHVIADTKENREGWATDQQAARFYLIQLGLVEPGERDITAEDLEEWETGI